MVNDTFDFLQFLQNTNKCLFFSGLNGFLFLYPYIFEHINDNELVLLLSPDTLSIRSWSLSEMSVI